MTSAAWLGHGLQSYVGPEYKRIGWICGASALLLLGIGSFELIKTQFNKTVFKVLRVLFVGQYISLTFLMLNPSTSDFILAQLSSTISLILFILPIHLYNYLKTKDLGSGYILLTIFYSIIPGFIYNNQISINKWFNYHDISHVLMAVFMLFMIVSTSKLSMIKTNEHK